MRRGVAPPASATMNRRRAAMACRARSMNSRAAARLSASASADPRTSLMAASQDGFGHRARERDARLEEAVPREIGQLAGHELAPGIDGAGQPERLVGEPVGEHADPAGSRRRELERD